MRDLAGMRIAARSTAMTVSAAVSLALALGGCVGEEDEDGAVQPEDLVAERRFPSVEVPAGQEITRLCLSWQLGNDDPIFVNSVTMTSGPGWHHSNWFFVPEGTFSVDDGVWDCAGEFDPFVASLSGGVLFAQSTQSSHESQSFGQGAAVMVPPGSVVVSEIHLINAGERAVITDATLRLDGLSEEEVTIPLEPMAVDFHQLAIPPGQRSRFVATCDFTEANGAPLDMSLYYFLPHYHSYGRAMELNILGGPSDGESIFTIAAEIGEPLGRTMSPPVSLTGAAGLTFFCEYDNPTDRTIGFGNNRHDEMCMGLGFTDGGVQWAAGVLLGDPVLRGVEDGVAVYEGPCDVVGFAR